MEEKRKRISSWWAASVAPPESSGWAREAFLQGVKRIQKIRSKNETYNEHDIVAARRKGILWVYDADVVEYLIYNNISEYHWTSYIDAIHPVHGSFLAFASVQH